jgi:hypothetical protein
VTLQSEQISVPRHDQIHLSRLGALQDTVVRLVAQNTHRMTRSHDFGDAANLPHISHDVCLGRVELRSKRPGEPRKDARRDNECTPPFQNRLVRFLGKPSKKAEMKTLVSKTALSTRYR